MTQQIFGESYGGTPAENYQRFFVPSIGAPVADDLIGVAGLQPGERVLDVACGTGDVQAKPKDLRLPPPKDFLWQYIHSTPLAEAAAHADALL